MKNFHYFSPSKLTELNDLLNRYPDGCFFMAGGTDLMVLMKEQQIVPRCVIDLKSLGLSYIRQEGSEVVIGATTTLHAIESSPLIKEKCPVLANTCSDMASFPIRHLATIGGNLGNASPSADTAPPLLVLGAKVKTTGPGGSRIIPIGDWFVGPGQSALNKGEIILEIHVPEVPPLAKATYIKFKRNQGRDLALVGVAVYLGLDEEDRRCQEVRIALGAVAPKPIRATAAEGLLRNQHLKDELIQAAAAMAKETARPISDVRASDLYRQELVPILVKDAFDDLKALFYHEGLLSA